MSQRIEKLPELFLQVEAGTAVPCRQCRRTVDFGKSCILQRDPDGRLAVLLCHTCLISDDAPSSYLNTRLELIPIPGSRWRYSDPRSPGDQLDMLFLRLCGNGLVFDGPNGEWFCSREDWINHLATFRVRPFPAPPEMARA